VHEAIYCLLMMRDGFIAGSANITDARPGYPPGEIATETRDAPLDTVLSNSFGFGGTNATLIFSSYHG
jgi:3-oxoacyl-[acyl-carrier-protein] synthase-1